ncbi:efflux RND transporter permease subunit, partial [Desulfovibrio sp. OttesenSCG-928-G11]|nr:efflux RND transporter permease subunit [Desulfovibrio sp. OttesenSCG-928-G11]
VNSPKGMLDNGERQWFVGASDRLRSAADFAPIIIRYQNGAALRLADVATVTDSVEDTRNAGYVAGKAAVMLVLFKQPGANIIETVARVRAAMPTLRAWLPESADLTIVMDRSPSIKASVNEVERALLIAMGLVILVVFLFLRNARATFIPAVAVPLSLLGTFAVMYLAGFSLNHLSLMALTVATGFVVDDAIVVTENIVRHMEDGAPPLKAALTGSREVAFTVISISLSLVAIFIPILGMGGIQGRLFKEFAVSLSAAVLVSLLVSLLVTPMMCARLLKAGPESGPAAPARPGQAGRAMTAALGGGALGFCARIYARAIRLWGDFMDQLHEGYARTLNAVLRHKRLTLLILLTTIACNIYLYVIVPKGIFPQQDVGQIFGMFRADQSISFQAIKPKVEELMAIVQAHPAVNAVGGFIGGRGGGASGGVFISLKAPAERKMTAQQVINDLRGRLARVPGGELFLSPMQDLRIGGRRTRSEHQFTLQSDDLTLLRRWAPILTEAFKEIPGLVDVDSDQETRGLQSTVLVDRDVIARLNITQKQVDTALGLAFGQAFASTIYTDGNQYRVVLEYAPDYLSGPDNLGMVWVPAGGESLSAPSVAGTGLSGNAASSLFSLLAPGSESARLAPLAAFSSVQPTLTALSVSHQGQFTAATISFNLLPGCSLSDVKPRIDEIMNKLHVPNEVRGSFQGTAGMLGSAMADQPLLILAAVITLYIVLGILYESLIHPLTILSTLPTAGMGAILGLMLFGAEFTMIAFIGVLLLAGIVKKNAILMIDFAIEARRSEGLDAEAAIYKACLLRFRPIMMTTMAAVGGALPLLLGSGDGAEIRTPLGITIVGGLLVSQLLTLYTTPVLYLYLDRFSRRKKKAVLAPGTL